MWIVWCAFIYKAPSVSLLNCSTVFRLAVVDSRLLRAANGDALPRTTRQARSAADPFMAVLVQPVTSNDAAA